MRLLAVVLGCCLFTSPVRALEELRFDEKPMAALSNQDISANGQIALAIRPALWLHGESPHFIVHYRRITEAKKVALEIEYYLGYIAKTLGAGPERYARKSHVYVFEDENDWKTFLGQTTIPPWAASFAFGDELFLNVREGRTGMFDSQTLAHETTHAVVSRLYPGRRWPMWLSEGFAEQMSGQSISARMGVYNPRLLQRFQFASLPLDELTTITAYPSDLKEVTQLYQSSERLVRFLMHDNPPDHFPHLLDLLTSGETLESAIPKVYPDRYPDFAAFVKRYNQLPK